MHGRRWIRDVSASIKILEIFKKYVPLSQLAFCISKRNADDLITFQSNLIGVSILLLMNKRDDSQSVLEDRLIVAKFDPTAIICFHCSGPFSPIFDQNPKIPTINFEEYGNNPFKPNEYILSHRFKKYSLGLNTKDNKDPNSYALGVFQDKDLINYFIDKRNESSLYRLLENLPKLPLSLFSAIVGEEKKEDFIQQITKFKSQKTMYFGYLNGHNKRDYQRAFIGAAILLENEKNKGTKDINFIFPGNPRLSTPLDLSKELIDFLIEQGFSKVEFLNSLEIPSEVNPLKKTTFDLIPNCQKNRRILTLIAAPLNHSDLIHIIKASESEVLCTGDQSASECLTAGKRIFYETLSHKFNFALTICNLVNDICKKDISFHYSHITTEKTSFAVKIKWLHEHYKKIESKKWDNFIEEIHKNQNCENKIINVFLTFLDTIYEY